MKTSQHIFLFLFSGLAIFLELCTATSIALDGWMNPGWVIAAWLAGMLLPDIEFGLSYPWELAKPYSVLLCVPEERGWDPCLFREPRYGKGHVGFFHSIAGLFLSTAVFYLIVFAVIDAKERTENIAFTAGAFFISYLCHLLQDVTCRPGLCLFWPKRRLCALTDLFQFRDMEIPTSGYWKKTLPVTLFSLSIGLVIWAACLLLPTYTKGFLLNVGYFWMMLMEPIIRALTAWLGETLLLRIMRGLLVMLFIPILFRTPLTKRIIRRKEAEVTERQRREWEERRKHILDDYVVDAEGKGEEAKRLAEKKRGRRAWWKR